MDIQAYIDSGILEAYALGALSDEECIEVEANIALYPELAGELDAVEESLRLMSEANAVEPPALLQDKIWDAVQEQSPVKDNSTAPKIIPLKAEYRSNISWQRAAILLVLVGSVIVNFVLWNQRNAMHEEQLALTNSMDTLKQQQQLLAQQVAHYNKLNDMVADTTMQTVVMQSMVKGHPMAATVYWSKNTGDAYLSVQKLPMPPAGMQYQMWVIQDGKPVSMGVLPNTIVDNVSMQKLASNVKAGQAFAISLEKEGGNPAPTSVYVLGKITS